MHEYQAKVIKVVDGDTIDLDIDLGFDIILSKQRIRLYGIDTPESRTRDQEEKHYGKLSSSFVKSRCKKGTYITLRTHLDKKGKFGRILGELIVEGTNLNKQMIKEFLAVKYFGQSKQAIVDGHLKNRVKLTENGMGYGPRVRKPKKKKKPIK